MRAVLLAVVIAAFASAAAADDAWYPSKYGKDDTLGAVNNLSPAIVIEAAKLVKTGKAYSLGVDDRTGHAGLRHAQLPDLHRGEHHR